MVVGVACLPSIWTRILRLVPLSLLPSIWTRILRLGPALPGDSYIQQMGVSA